jgi:hypothetical protein
LRGGGVETGAFLHGTSKEALHYVEMEYVGDLSDLPEQGFKAPSGRTYKFKNDEHKEYVHPMDMNYLRAIYPVERIPWRGST